jgi:hypothetical protein
VSGGGVVVIVVVVVLSVILNLVLERSVDPLKWKAPGIIPDRIFNVITRGVISSKLSVNQPMSFASTSGQPGASFLATLLDN